MKQSEARGTQCSTPSTIFGFCVNSRNRRAVIVGVAFGVAVVAGCECETVLPPVARNSPGIGGLLNERGRQRRVFKERQQGRD